MTIPEGFLEDAHGNLVPKKNIKPIDLLRDDLVRRLAGEAKSASRILSIFKTVALTELSEFLCQSALEYGVTKGGKKGNLTLYTFDGRYKIVKAISPHTVFDERLQVAKQLIDECIAEWSEGVNGYLKVLIDDAFKTNSDGNVSVSRVLGLRKHDINDPKWLEAMRAIADSVTANDSTTYLRAYERVTDTDQYRPIPLSLPHVPLQKDAEDYP
ncbi:DUF3164 family protein [Paremcibacter congregatus]|uniref:DUF3164 family protein n=1 Tax=Paremcibacter congregatus TaxID=2043170 RepID=UPI0030EC820B|tara:strand:+ start:2745 stop:3383 length:639 start_codon:yes stop_codon:yes gene_type:complete